MSVIIKKMETDSEIRGKAYVHWKSWHETYPGIVDRSYLDAMTLEKCEEIAFRWPDGTFVAIDGGEVVGFLAYGEYRGGGLEDAGEITAVYLLADRCRRGLGTRLMRAGLEELAGFPRVAVRVLKENTGAIRFYERCGFLADGHEETLVLGSPVTAVRMVLERQSGDCGGKI